MKPLPWGPTALADFVSCPRSYYEKRVAKSVPPQPETPEQLWGLRVHKAFEERQRDGTPLDADLAEHEPFMLELANQYGDHYTEQKVALNKIAKPCEFFAPDVWWRGVIDWACIAHQFAVVYDYKTGKPHNKFDQLVQYVIYILQAYPSVQEVAVGYYWTKTKGKSTKHYYRSQLPELWQMFVPDLKQYVEAFKTDIWQPRQSGLCRGWCPIEACEFWRPKR